MSGTNGTATAAAPVALALAEERDYYCPHCGRWLLASTMPPGTSGGVRVRCPESACRQYTELKLGQTPAPRVDRNAWVGRRQLERASERTSGTRF